MRAAPAVQVNVQHFGAWNALLGVALVAAACSGSAWLALCTDGLPAAGVWCVAALIVAALAGASTAFRRHPVVLRWDSQCWYVSARRTGEPVGPQQVRVMLDAGEWMLLKFVPDFTAKPSRAQWVAVQRLGLELQWHALRCALYSPRAGALGATGAAGFEGRLRVD
jgi:hypothetical protein